MVIGWLVAGSLAASVALGAGIAGGKVEPTPDRSAWWALPKCEPFSERGFRGYKILFLAYLDDRMRDQVRIASDPLDDDDRAAALEQLQNLRVTYAATAQRDRPMPTCTPTCR